MAEHELVCPRCARTHPASERFCGSCGMPLVQQAGEQPPGGELREKARKIKPEYADGALVTVARAKNLMQAEFIAGLLLEEGIPSMLRGSIAGYSPMMGGRDVLVPESGAQAAREALAWERP
ncbi:MAG: putative signal transducing protein [Solirubrobacteraceae bacterium]